MNPAPDYARFPYIPFNLWERVVNWANSRKTIYSPEVQELFEFFDRFKSERPFTKPLYSYPINSSEKLGQDLVSFRHTRLQKWVGKNSKPEDAFWRLEYYWVIDEVIDVPTELHLRQILLGYTYDETRLKKFSTEMDGLIAKIDASIVSGKTPVRVVATSGFSLEVNRNGM